MNLDQGLYYIASLVSVSIFLSMPWAIEQLLRAEINVRLIRKELRDVIHSFYVFLVWNAVQQSARILVHAFHWNLNTVLLTAALNTARDLSGGFTLLAIYLVFHKRSAFKSFKPTAPCQLAKS